MLALMGADPTVATYSGVHLRIEDSVEPFIRSTILEDFPGAIIVQNDDPQAALSVAGLRHMDIPAPGDVPLPA